MEKISKGGYKIIKYCRLCRKRMVLEKGEARQNYCKECQKKFEKN